MQSNSTLSKPAITGLEPGRILIVDDEANIRAGLKAVLLKDGHHVKDVGSGEEALQVLAMFPCEVAIVDIRMVGMTGTVLLHEIKIRWPHVSVILLTGHGTLETAMTAVQEGAHDYLLKPAQPDTIRQTVNEALFATRREREQSEMLESLRTSMERLGVLPARPTQVKESTAERQPILVGDLTIDVTAHEVRRNEMTIALTPSEFQLLVALAIRQGQVVNYVTLVQLSLDYEAESWEAKELIKRHIFSLRKKIEPEPASPQYLVNVRGVGYRLVAP